jgi:hypothetical protein
MLVAPGARPFVATMLRSRGANAAAATTVRAARWLTIDGDSLWLEPVDLPDAPGALVAYVPSFKWAYTASAASPLHLDRVLALARARGWTVERVGSARAVAAPVPSGGAKAP